MPNETNNNSNLTEAIRLENLENAFTAVQAALGTIVEKIGSDEKELNVKERMKEEINIVYEAADEQVKLIRKKYKPLIKSYNREHDIIEKSGRIAGSVAKPFSSFIDGLKEGARR